MTYDEQTEDMSRMMSNLATARTFTGHAICCAREQSDEREKLDRAYDLISEVYLDVCKRMQRYREGEE